MCYIQIYNTVIINTSCVLFHSFCGLVVETMNVIGPTLDLSTRIWIQVGSVVCLLRPCSMFLQRTEQNIGKSLRI